VRVLARFQRLGLTEASPCAVSRSIYVVRRALPSTCGRVREGGWIHWKVGLALDPVLVVNRKFLQPNLTLFVVMTNSLHVSQWARK
jgi:hypothetical protein